MSDHISEDLALILAALDQDDPERRAALAHAESCPACARLLTRGASVLGLIDAQRACAKVDPQLRARILASIDRFQADDEFQQERPGTRWEPIALVIGALLSIALALLDGRERQGLFPDHAPLCIMWQMLGTTLSLSGVRLWAHRRSAWRASALRLAVVAMGGALGGQLWLRIRCPSHDAGLHLFTFHVTGVLLGVLLGWVTARVIRRADQVEL
jgi:hypothetical protein